ncbi:hypothetical protein M422DRAFT_205380 [Sphaerobolus stellatus SS14]|nr:hypothetical protein M422DRAFT_205380 [Sphaerobolus stellatus SS14]
MFGKRDGQRTRWGALCGLLMYLPVVMGATSFVWAPDLSPANTSLVECSKIQIFVATSASNTAVAAAPFIMFAYEVAGLTTIQNLGSDPDNLFWTVDHPASAQIVLSMVDGKGNSGGTSGQVFTVFPGNSTDCHAPNEISSISVTTNTTKTLETCQVLPLTVGGGTPPYNISVVTLGSADGVSNITMPVGFDTTDWVNRANPGAKLLVSISDSKGIYAPSTNLLTTFGDSDFSCDRMLTTQRNSSSNSVTHL